eukprot:scaffold71184_cov23-Tisochrysis_lutea.AAC.1
MRTDVTQVQNGCYCAQDGLAVGGQETYACHGQHSALRMALQSRLGDLRVSWPAQCTASEKEARRDWLQLN